MVQALTLRAAAGRAAAAGFWKTRRFCTASNAAIRRLWVWRVSHIALPDRPHLPPTAPQTHGRVHTQLHQGAGCAGADLDRATPHTHAARLRKPGRDSCPVAGRAFGHASDGAGSGIGRPPGIMPPTPSLPCSSCYMAPPAYPPQKNSARSGPREHSASLYTKCTRFDIIAVVYTCTTVASRAAANARSHTRKTLLVAPSSHAPHTHEHSSERSQPWSPEPLVYINSWPPLS